MKIKNLLKKCRYNENDIDINELNEIRRINKEAILLDVRSSQEFEEGHLSGAINIPVYELETSLDYKIKETNKIIIVYCQSGVRSKKAIKILNKKGFKKLYHLNNGLDGI